MLKKIHMYTLSCSHACRVRTSDMKCVVEGCWQQILIDWFCNVRGHRPCKSQSKTYRKSLCFLPFSHLPCTLSPHSFAATHFSVSCYGSLFLNPVILHYLHDYQSFNEQSMTRHLSCCLTNVYCLLSELVVLLSYFQM